MKSTLLFLFAALHTGFSFAQFDPNYFGQYRTDAGDEFYYFSEYEGNLDRHFTEEQQKNVAFFFTYEGATEMFAGVAMKKGTNYASHVNEATPELTFAFKNENDLPTVIVTDKSGNKLSLTKINFDSYYYDEENATPVYQDEELGDADYDYYYGDEETIEDMPSVFQFTRADKGELLLFMKNDLISISLTIPATKSCPAIEISGDLVQQAGSENIYFYTDPSGYKLKAEMITKNENPGWKFSCASGKCPDANNKCGIWKEEFILGY